MAFATLPITIRGMKVDRPVHLNNAHVMSKTSLRTAAPEATSERILRAALDCFAERGFEGATTRAIAAKAGVAQGLLTYHYASKQDLWEASANWVFGKVNAEFDGALEALRDLDAVTRLRVLMKRFVRFLARYPEVHRFISHEGSHDGPRLQWLAETHLAPLQNQSTAVISGALPHVDPVLFYYSIVGAMAHVFTIAPSFRLVTQRDAFADETVEAQAITSVDWLIDGALMHRPANDPPDRKGRG